MLLAVTFITTLPIRTAVRPLFGKYAMFVFGVPTWLFSHNLDAENADPQISNVSFYEKFCYLDSKS